MVILRKMCAVGLHSVLGAPWFISRSILLLVEMRVRAGLALWIRMGCSGPVSSLLSDWLVVTRELL